MDPSSQQISSNKQQHTVVVLFYKYFDGRSSCKACCHRIREQSQHAVHELQEFQKSLCAELDVKGRVLLASEGINGTLSAASVQQLDTYIQRMEQYHVCSSDVEQFAHPGCGDHRGGLFAGTDWKKSASSQNLVEPFPDVKVSIVKEIVSTGGVVAMEEIAQFGGQHLTPQQFHSALLKTPAQDLVLIDVRNTFEHEIGHFVHPTTQQPAINPQMVTFSSFDGQFCQKHAPDFQDKTVLMYCTGGIRCEKASVMLKKRGVHSVHQLQGGIHRYLEEFGTTGYFKGLNFVFDQRVALKPSLCSTAENRSENGNTACLKTSSVTEGEAPNNHILEDTIVGTCVECRSPFDEISGSRLCTVCRDLVLVCPACQHSLREYHCRRHAAWKTAYFTFLEVFNEEQLNRQRTTLLQLRDEFVPAKQHRNIRRTISRQVEKIGQRLQDLQNGVASVDPQAPRRCRTCMEPSTVCDGMCWGFWKTSNANSTNTTTNNAPTILPIQVGDSVQPGEHWSTLRLGTKYSNGDCLRQGKVIELKTWGSGGSEKDCVVVNWVDATDLPRRQPQIYRWGVLAGNGMRMYDVEKSR